MTDTVVEIPISGSALPIAGGSESASPGGCPRFFLAGPENRLACVAAESILSESAPMYNPVVLFGPSGCGKTHLAAGLVDAWRRRFGPRSAIYVPAIDFARQWTDAIETQSTDDFHNRYGRPELLAIDDVDVLSGKLAAQEELIHRIDALIAAGSRLMLTAAVAPGAIPAMIPALQSRLVGGLVVRMSPPGQAVRLTAARKFAEMRGVALSDEAIATLIEGLPASLSAIWAAMLHLEVSARTEGGPSEGERDTLRQVREYLVQRGSQEPSLREIAMATARHFALRLSDLRSGSRRRAVVAARDVAMYLARTLTHKSFDQIGSYFNGRDHSTVAHGCSKTAELLQSDLGLQSAVDQLRQQIRAAAPRAAGSDVENLSMKRRWTVGPQGFVNTPGNSASTPNSH